jgi:hypothetical protein
MMTARVISKMTQKRRPIARMISSIVAVGTLAVLAYGFIQDRQPALLELKKTAAAVPYDDLTRRPEDHIGQIVSFRGKVIQVVPGEHDDKVVGLIIWIGEGLTSLNDLVYVDYQAGLREPRILEDDVVEFWGRFNGITLYEANHSDVEVPHVVAYGIERIEWKAEKPARRTVQAGRGNSSPNL